MESKIMRVFFGNDCLPYQDSARSVHYPVVGSTFTGSNNTTQIRFYVDRIGGATNVTWVAQSKLPNGKLGYKVLENPSYDSELGEQYLTLDLSAYYTSTKGELYIALNGYQGGVLVEEDEDTGIYEISGSPTIQVTGVIKIAINYAPQMLPNSNFSFDELQMILGYFSDYIKITSGIVVVTDISLEDLSTYKNTQIIFDKETKDFYKVVVTTIPPLNEGDDPTYEYDYVPYAFDLQDLDIHGELRISENGRILVNPSQIIDDDDRTLQSKLNAKLAIVDGIVVGSNLTGISVAGYEDGQMFFDVSDKTFYRKNGLLLLKYEKPFIDQPTFTNETITMVQLKYGSNYFVYSNSLCKIVSTSSGGITITKLYAWNKEGYGERTVTPTTQFTTAYSNLISNNFHKYLLQTNEGDIVYGTDELGQQKAFAVDSDIVAGADGVVVRREYPSGRVAVGRPVNNYDATTKSYVDDGIQDAKDYAKNYADTLFTSALVYKGTLSCSQISALDTSTIKTGDFYNVSDSGTITWTISGTTYTLDVLQGDNIAWAGSSWDKLTMDLSVYDDKFIAAGFFEVQDYDEENGTITLVYASDLYNMSYNTHTGVLTIEAN